MVDLVLNYLLGYSYQVCGILVSFLQFLKDYSLNSIGAHKKVAYEKKISTSGYVKRTK